MLQVGIWSFSDAWGLEIEALAACRGAGGDDEVWFTVGWFAQDELKCVETGAAFGKDSINMRARSGCGRMEDETHVQRRGGAG